MTNFFLINSRMKTKKTFQHNYDVQTAPLEANTSKMSREMETTEPQISSNTCSVLMANRNRVFNEKKPGKVETKVDELHRVYSLGCSSLRQPFSCDRHPNRVLHRWLRERVVCTNVKNSAGIHGLRRHCRSGHLHVPLSLFLSLANDDLGKVEIWKSSVKKPTPLVFFCSPL